jgi:excisionase family DNA binding protein
MTGQTRPVCPGKEEVVDRLLLRPTEAAEVLGLGRSKVYEMLGRGELPQVRVGGSVRVPIEALREWVLARATETRNED